MARELNPGMKAWLEASKEWRKNNPSGKLPKKGTAGYAQIKKRADELKKEAAKK